MTKIFTFIRLSDIKALAKRGMALLGMTFPYFPTPASHKPLVTNSQTLQLRIQISEPMGGEMQETLK